jgi:hypothetical protein
MVGMALSQIIGNNHSGRPNTVLKQKKSSGLSPEIKQIWTLSRKGKLIWQILKLASTNSSGPRFTLVRPPILSKKLDLARQPLQIIRPGLIVLRRARPNNGKEQSRSAIAACGNTLPLAGFKKQTVSIA